MKSVLEALGGKLHHQLAPSPPLNASPPMPSESSRVTHIYNNVPISGTTTYQTMPLLVTTSANDTFSSSLSNPNASHYDVPRLLINAQQPVIMPSQPSVTDSKPPDNSKPMPNPRHSPSQSRSHYYAVPRPVSSITVENVYDVPRASNNQPLSPTSNAHYDIPRITSHLPASKSHYDVPRQSAAEPLRSPAHLPRTSSDPDLLDKDTIKVPETIPRAFTPPITPRRFTNKAKTLDGSISSRDMQKYNYDAKRNDSKKKPPFKRRQN